MLLQTFLMYHNKLLILFAFDPKRLKPLLEYHEDHGTVLPQKNEADIDAGNR